MVRRQDVGQLGNGGQFGQRRRGEGPDVGQPDVPSLDEVLASAAHLQELVPDAVLVGGTEAAAHAHHRLSVDHDHVLMDLRDRFEMVLDALEEDPEFVLNRSTPGKIILGRLEGIEVGVRQLIRRRPLEVERLALPDGRDVTIPTEAEILRIKAYLIVKRNQVRDYLDVAALSAHMGVEEASIVLAHIDDYYTDPRKSDAALSAQMVRQLAEPRPKDSSRIGGLATYKGLEQRWNDWEAIVSQLRRLAAHLTRQGGQS